MKSLSYELIAIVLAVALVGGGLIVWDVLTTESEPDVIYDGLWNVEYHTSEDYICQDITVKNVGDESFHVTIEDWEVSSNGVQYSPHILASYLRGFTEAIVQPGHTYTFTLLYEIPKGIVVDEVYFYYIGDENVVFDQSLV